jgi:hypothetical protein
MNSKTQVRRLILLLLHAVLHCIIVTQAVMTQPFRIRQTCMFDTVQSMHTLALV